MNVVGFEYGMRLFREMHFAFYGVVARYPIFGKDLIGQGGDFTEIHPTGLKPTAVAGKAVLDFIEAEIVVGEKPAVFNGNPD